MEPVRLLVNSGWHVARAAPGIPALDVIRGELHLTATKEGCREGDCGACAVIVGEWTSGGILRYRAVPSCLLATGDLEGKHLLTLEGLVEGARDGLTPVMRAFLDENASQCGFCTPGFIMALTSWLAEPQVPDLAGALRAVDGNLCRCTGYAAIRRAARRLMQEFADLPLDPVERLKALVEAQVLPSSVLEYLARGPNHVPADFPVPAPASMQAGERIGASAVVGGGTDYYVRNPDPEAGFAPLLIKRHPSLAHIRYHADAHQQWLEVGAAVTVRDFFSSPLVRSEVPGIERYETAFASTLIRNLATVGGNIVNASPVADMTAMLMALGATLVTAPSDLPPGSERLIPIEAFFLGYKKLDLAPGEILKAIRLPAGRCANGTLHFSFEKISKRRNLDIAAVNTALAFTIEEGRCKSVRLSLGGVAPIPILSDAARNVLEGAMVPLDDPKALARLARATAQAAAAAVSPIDDVRGSAEYRRRMVHQLILAHFVRLFESSGIAEELFP